MNTDEKNNKLKSCLLEVGKLLYQLEQDNQLNLISQGNKEDLLMLKKGVDGLIRDGLLHTDPKDSVQKTNSAATPTDTSVPESDEPFDSAKYFEKLSADPPTPTSAPESVDWKISKSKSIFGTKPEISQDLLDEFIKNEPKPELDEDGKVIFHEPKTLVANRNFYGDPHNVEKDLLYYTHNALVEYKLQIKKKTRRVRKKNKNGHEISAQKYKQVNVSDKVRDYRELEGRYKHARSFSSYKSYLRKVSWHALRMDGSNSYSNPHSNNPMLDNAETNAQSTGWSAGGNPTYDPVVWWREIRKAGGVESLTGGGSAEYAERIDDNWDLILQIGKGGKGLQRKPKDATNLEKKMVVEDD